METNKTYYTDLISRYFFGEATPGEILALEEWVKADPANATLFSEYQKTWQAIEKSKIESSIHIDHEWDQLESRLKIKSSDLNYERNGDLNPPSEIVHRKFHRLSFALRIAAISLLLLLPAFFLYRYFTNPSDHQLAAGNEIMECVLPDGTSVTLNAGTTLTYPSRFTGSIRQVTLNGEGWFEVAHNKAKPFIIASGNVRVRVVGTSFSFNTKTPGDKQVIYLSTGIVKVYFENRPDKSALLVPGEKAEINDAGSDILKTSNNDVNFISWKTKHIVFSNTPLDEVVKVLTKVYRTPVTIHDNNLRDCRITATFDQQSLESLLQVLKATLDIRISQAGGGIELSGKGCNQGR
ncbi:MAG: FecR domain-containing protein [Bacteroidales bacterium]